MIAFFDCVHDMGDPLGTTFHVCHAIISDGIWMIVESHANDRFEDNLKTVIRAFYGGSTLVCVPASLAQKGSVLGSQVGEAKLSEIIKSATFKWLRFAAKTPFNLILEANDGYL